MLDNMPDKNEIHEKFKKLFNGVVNEFLNTKTAIIHNKKKDCAEFIIKKGKYYIESIDDILSVYHNKKTNEITGGLIKNISKQLQKADEQNLKGFIVELNINKNVFGNVFLVKEHINSDFQSKDFVKYIYEF